MKLLSHLQRHSIRDLACHALFELRDALDMIISTAILRLKCLLLGIPLGGGAKAWGKVHLRRFPGSEIRIGRNVRIVSRPRRYGYNIFPQSKIRTFLPSARVVIADGVGFNSVNILARSKTISIGEGTIIGGNCQIMDTDGHPLWPPERRQYYPGDEHDSGVSIGKNVFIGLNVIVLKGVTIGDNAVIGAGSVVSRSIPSDCVAAGVPAGVVRQFKR